MQNTLRLLSHSSAPLPAQGPAQIRRKADANIQRLTHDTFLPPPSPRLIRCLKPLAQVRQEDLLALQSAQLRTAQARQAPPRPTAKPDLQGVGQGQVRPAPASIQRPQSLRQPPPCHVSLSLLQPPPGAALPAHVQSRHFLKLQVRQGFPKAAVQERHAL